MAQNFAETLRNGIARHILKEKSPR